MICPKCKIGKLYISKTSKDGKTLKVKCIICETGFNKKQTQQILRNVSKSA